MVVYISGKITGNLDYQADFTEAERKLTMLGLEVINPAKLSVVVPSNADHDDYMRICTVLLDMADAIYMIPGWETSKGSCIEYGYALAKDLSMIK